MYLCAVDLGDVADYTAVIIADVRQAGPERRYEVCHVERLPLGSGYPRVLAHLQALLAPGRWTAADQVLLDITGVGLPVFQFMEQHGLRPVGILCHGGQTARREHRIWHTPKTHLIAAAQVALQTGRILLDPRLPLVDILVHELRQYRVTIDPRTAHESYAAWREKDHDDLVFALAMVVWFGDHGQPKRAGVWGTTEERRPLLDAAGQPVESWAGYIHADKWR